MTRLYSFDDHPEHRARLDSWAQEWIDNALSTVPANRAVCREAVAGLYHAVHWTPPKRIAFVASPMTAAIAGTVAAGAWWLRAYPGTHYGLFLRQVSEQEVMAAILPACEAAVAEGMAALTGEDRQPFPASAVDAAVDAAIYAATAPTDDAGEYYDQGNYLKYDDELSATALTATHGLFAEITDRAAYWATSDATRAAVDAATYDVAHRATFDATDFGSREATYQVTDRATYLATHGATEYDIDDTGDAYFETYEPVDVLGSCLDSWDQMYVRADDWSARSADISFFRHVAHLDLPEYESWQHFETLARQSGGQMMHEQFCIIANRQTSIHLDEENRLHNPDGPARTWADGWAVWAWHGIRVPQALIEGRWTPADILREPDVEIRRCAIERMGWAPLR